MSFIFLRNRVAGGAAFTPASLFASGEEGAWYEPSPTTCFTDTAGTIAAGVGDAVARINDLSGNGNHATQATAAARPLLQQTAGGLYYLAFDGSDDGMATASIDFTATDKMSVFAGVEKESDATIGQLVELSAIVVTNNGSFSMPSAVIGASWDVFVKGTGTFTNTTATGFAAPITTVNTGLFDLSLATGDGKLRVDGVLRATTSTDTGGGNFGNYPLNIGARDNAASFWFDGKLFSLIVRGAASSAGEISDTESYVASKSGVTL